MLISLYINTEYVLYFLNNIHFTTNSVFYYLLGILLLKDSTFLKTYGMKSFLTSLFAVLPEYFLKVYEYFRINGGLACLFLKAEVFQRVIKICLFFNVHGFLIRFHNSNL